jgi:hypothetical protein
MSFEVRSNSPMDDDWLARDDAIIAAAGRKSSFSGSGVGEAECIGRDHGWYVATFEEAVALKQRLETVPFVTATFREQTTYK